MCQNSMKNIVNRKFSFFLTRTPLSSKHGHDFLVYDSLCRCSFTAGTVWQKAHVFPESNSVLIDLIVQPSTFKGKLCFSLFSASFRITYVYVEYRLVLFIHMLYFFLHLEVLDVLKG